MKPFSSVEKRYLRWFYPVASTAVLAARLHRSVASLTAHAHKQRLCKGPDYVASTAGRFPKGLVPWNAGLNHAPEGSRATQFRKGQESPRANALGDGAVTVRDRQRGGYLYVRAAPGKWALLHRVAWEQAHGPIPAGYVLRAKSTTLNPDPANWELLSRAAHGLRNEVGVANTPAVRLTDRAVAGILGRLQPTLRPLLLACAPLLEVKRQQLLLQRALRASQHG